MVLPCPVHSPRETGKPHLMPALLETITSVPDYAPDAGAKQSNQKALMLLKGIGKLQPDEVFGMTSITPACYSFWAVTG